MGEIPDEIFKVIGSVVAVGGTGAAVAYGLFVWFGKAWLGRLFTRQLEDLRHEHAKDVEHFRQEATRVFSRISKIHDREFSALPDAWEKLIVAHSKAARLASGMQQLPDFDQLSPPDLEAFLAGSGLSSARQDEIRGASDKAATYLEAKFWADLGEARQSQAALHNCVGINWIFMTDELRDGFLAVDRKMKDALLAVEIEHRHPPGGRHVSDAYQDLRAMDSEIDELGRKVQVRLRYADA